VVGLRKPEVAIYREMLTRLDLSPHQVAFVDDFPENVEAARAVGIHGLLFLGEAECRRQLHALGVPVTMT
jgi:HAD superfamily hydrolase (TIGR01509 family)